MALDHPKQLQLSDNFGDDCFSNLQFLEELIDINLYRCTKVTNKGIEYLAKLPQLRTLYCGGCHKVISHRLKTFGNCRCLHTFKIIDYEALRKTIFITF